MFNNWCALLTFSLSCYVLRQVATQNLDVPPIACPRYFEYLCYDIICIGKITLHDKLGKTTVDVEFSQRNPVQQNNYGTLSLFENKDTTIERIRNGEPISYRVDFPYSNVLPKLTKLSVNGIVICYANGYPPPFTTIMLQHTLTASVHTTYTSVPYTIQNGRIIPGRPQTLFTTQQQTRPRQKQPQKPYGYNNQQQNQRTPSITQPTSDIFSYPIQQEQTKFNQRGEHFPQTPVKQFERNPFFPTRESNTQAPFPQIQQQPSFNTPRQPVQSIPQQSSFYTPREPVQRYDERITPPAVQPVQKPTFMQPRDPFANNQVACGREGRTTAVVPFIRGGTVLQPGQFPWLTAIYHKSLIGTSFICGGSLISARTILSAAHCFQLTQLTAEKLMVTLGRYNLSNSMETSVVTRDIKTLLINPEYDPNMFPDADVALLLMSSPVSFTNFISPICLWGGPEDSKLLVNQTGYVAGWGGDEDGNQISAVPKMAPANIVSESVCRQSSEIFKLITTSRTLCAGQQNGVGPCMGDSGGGLMIQRDGVWQLRGIVSAGLSDKQSCDLHKYVVYCDVAKFSHWVHSYML